MNPCDPPAALIWSLRPAGEHSRLRAAARAAGLRLAVLPTLRLRARAPGATLHAALKADLRIYTSPAAARFAARQAVLAGAHGIDIAVGQGTASALRSAGVFRPLEPSRMDSEGLLALAQLQNLAGRSVGLVTAPGGRGLLSVTLAERGAEVIRADVYERLPLRLTARQIAAFERRRTDVVLASSVDAVRILAQALIARRRRAGPDEQERPVVASSSRLAAEAQALGPIRLRIAENATPPAMVAAAVSLLAEIGSKPLP